MSDLAPAMQGATNMHISQGSYSVTLHKSQDFFITPNYFSRTFL